MHRNHLNIKSAQRGGHLYALMTGAANGAPRNDEQRRLPADVPWFARSIPGPGHLYTHQPVTDIAPISCLTDEDLEAYGDPARRSMWLMQKAVYFCTEGARTGATKETVASQLALLEHLAQLAKAASQP